MCLFIESICIQNGSPQNIALHQKRIKHTQLHFFKKYTLNNISNVIQLPKKLTKTKLVKCRIIYDIEIKKIEFEKYKFPKIKTLKIVKAKNLNYQFKFENRTALQKLFSQKQHCNDIIISHEGMLSDSYFCNLVFEDNNKNLFTPQTPLLKGTKRTQYLKEKKIKLKKIHEIDIKKYKKLHLINCMINLFELTIDIKNIK